MQFDVQIQMFANSNGTDRVLPSRNLRGNDDPSARLGLVMRFLCLFHVQGVAQHQRCRPADEKQRKRRKREESRWNVLYLRHEPAYSPWNKETLYGGAQGESYKRNAREEKNVKTSSATFTKNVLHDLEFHER